MHRRVYWQSAISSLTRPWLSAAIGVWTAPASQHNILLLFAPVWCEKSSKAHRNMTSTSKSIIIGIIGLIIFCMGSGLRLQAEKLSTIEITTDLEGVPLKDKPGYNGRKAYMEDSDRKHSIADISLVLLWSGGTLVILSLAGWFLSKDQDPAKSVQW